MEFYWKHSGSMVLKISSDVYVNVVHMTPIVCSGMVGVSSLLAPDWAESVSSATQSRPFFFWVQSWRNEATWKGELERIRYNHRVWMLEMQPFISAGTAIGWSLRSMWQEQHYVTLTRRDDTSTETRRGKTGQWVVVGSENSLARVHQPRMRGQNERPMTGQSRAAQVHDLNWEQPWYRAWHGLCHVTGQLKDVSCLEECANKHQDSTPGHGHVHIQTRAVTRLNCRVGQLCTQLPLWHPTKQQPHSSVNLCHLHRC